MTRRLKLLHVATTTAGGLGQSLLSITTGLNRQRYDVHVAFGTGHPFDNAFCAAGIPVYPLALSRGVNPLRMALCFFQLKRILKTQRFDIVHVHGSLAGILGRIAARWVKTPVIVAELHGYATRDPNGFMENTVFRWLEQRLDPITDAYVAVSAAVARAWVARGVANAVRIQVIHHGIDLAPFTLTPAAPVPRSDPGAKIIGTVCLLEERKGMMDLVEALPYVIESCGPIVCWIVGDGPLKAAMIKRLRELGMDAFVRFLGWRDDVPQIMAQLNVFVLPSRRESFGLVFLEAMASRCPIVATRIDGIPEVVADGETGLLVEPGNPRLLGAAIVRLLQDAQLAKNLGEAGRQRVSERFTRTAMASAYEALYEKLWTAQRRTTV
ncbi:MAG: glycosyltransferase family 4 protein [Gammaproteobacteria bacterium]